MNNSKWVNWKERKKLPHLSDPGIYFIAFPLNGQSDEDFHKEFLNKDFKICKQIIYIGMSIAKKGVGGRLNQFENTMKGNARVHGGADRVRFKHKSHEIFFKKAIISIKSFPISTGGNISTDLRIKGECVKHEFVSFAEYFDKFNELPEFNDHKKSKKK